MPTASGVRNLLWRLSGEFERSLPGWKHTLLVWRATRLDEAGVTLAANLCARQGHDGLEVRSVVWARPLGSSLTVRSRAFVALVTNKLRTRGYKLDPDPLPEQPLLAVRDVSSGELRGEHLFLSALAGKRVSPLPRRLSNTVAFSKTIEAATAWSLHESEWTLDRKTHVCGKEAKTHARVRIAPPGGISSEISVQVWLPWSRRGQAPRWLGMARRVLARQLRAGGLTIQRTPSEPALVFAFRAPPRGARAVMLAARQVGALRLGDESERPGPSAARLAPPFDARSRSGAPRAPAGSVKQARRSPRR